MSLKAFLRLARIEHSIFLAVAVLVGELIVTIEPPFWPTVFALLSVFLIGIGSFTLIDFLDYRTDKKNKRKDRPLVTGHISLWTAITAAKVTLPLGILFAAMINLECFVTASVFALLAILYSYILKKLPLVGNMFIAFSMAVPFLFGNYVISPVLATSVHILVYIAFLTGVGREIIKSIQDMVGDKKYGRRTLPIVLGRSIPAFFACVYILEAVAMSVIPFLFLPKFVGDWLYMGPVIVTDLLLIISVWYTVNLKKLEKVRKMTLLALGIGLLGFLLGAL